MFAQRKPERGQSEVRVRRAKQAIRSQEIRIEIIGFRSRSSNEERRGKRPETVAASDYFVITCEWPFPAAEA